MRIPRYKTDHRSVGFVVISLVVLIGFIVCFRPAKKDETVFSHSEHIPMTVQDHKKNESVGLNDKSSKESIVLEDEYDESIILKDKSNESIVHKNKSDESIIHEDKSDESSIPKEKTIEEKTVPSQSELEKALNEASTPNKTVIITMLNKAYAESDGLLNLFLQSFHEGENTKPLIDHILFVTVDRIAFYQCVESNLHCYRLGTDGGDLSDEVLYMTNGFNDMMWNRTRFLGDVLRLGYNFIFTDMDILWLRNPFINLKRRDDEDMLLNCDGYNGLPYDDRNSINTGFFFTASNNKTINLFEKWYEARNTSNGMKEQDVLNYMKSQGEFGKLGMKVRYLDLEHFSGMCQTKYNAKKVTTVHANCCRTMKAKVLDLSAMLKAWRLVVNGTFENIWPRHKACHDSWKIRGDEDDEMDTALKSVLREDKIVIITIFNKEYAKVNGFIDLFLRSLHEGVQTDYIMDRILFVAMDQIAFNRCVGLYLNCYMIEMDGADVSQEDLDLNGDFMKMVWTRTNFLRQVLERGYNLLYTDMDVLWLRNPLKSLISNKSEDIIISCEGQNGQSHENCNPINSGFFFVASNNKTISLFDKLYSERNNSLNYTKIQGESSEIDVKVRYLDTKHFSGLCQNKYSVRKIMILHSNCCRARNSKIMDLKSMLEAWLRSNNGGTKINWPEHKACIDSSKVPDEPETVQELGVPMQNNTLQIADESIPKDHVPDKLEKALKAASMQNKTLIITIVNKTHTQQGGLLYLFLKSMREGRDTEPLIAHLLIVTMDRSSFDRCNALNLHCYKGEDISHEEEERVWWRIRFYGDVLKRGYKFIFTDVDVIWLRNPFPKLNHITKDLLMSCDRFDGLPFKESTNPLNPGFFFVDSNNKTISFFTKWYDSKNNSEGLDQQDVLNNLKSAGVIGKLGVKIRVLNTAVFSGFCEHGKDFSEVITVHANCCKTAKAKLVDLKVILKKLKAFNGTEMTWPNQEACRE